LERVGVGQKDAKRDNQAKKAICFSKIKHLSFYNKKIRGERRNPLPPF